MSQLDRRGSFRKFLAGGDQTRQFVTLNPSSYASLFAGKAGGHPKFEDEIKFHRAFGDDAMVTVMRSELGAIAELKWKRRYLREDENGAKQWEETLKMPRGEKRRVVADSPGTTSWLMEPAVKSDEDFDLIDYYADCIRANAEAIAESISEYPPMVRELGMTPSMTILTPFEAYQLIDYPDMGVFFMDWPERYMASMKKIHASNMALLAAAVDIGVEVVHSGSAGMELLSPEIFRKAIVPFQREFNDQARSLGCHTSYHICGFSRELIEQKIIDDIKPTIFETCSTPPCGNNVSLREAVNGINDQIITKGGLKLELLRNGTAEEIAKAVEQIARDVKGRRHIIGQEDATILAGTPVENIRAFLAAVKSLET